MSIGDYFKIAVAIGLIAVGFTVAWKWQAGKIEKLRAERDRLEETNKANLETIHRLRQEIVSIQSMYEQRLREKDRFIQSLRERLLFWGKYENMGQGKKEASCDSESVKEGEDTSQYSGDAILDELNRMFPGNQN